MQTIDKKLRAKMVRAGAPCMILLAPIFYICSKNPSQIPMQAAFFLTALALSASFPLAVSKGQEALRRVSVPFQSAS
jgi:hypothetical protein